MRTHKNRVTKKKHNCKTNIFSATNQAKFIHNFTILLRTNISLSIGFILLLLYLYK